MNGDRNWGRLTWGIILIGLGAVFLMERVDWLPETHWVWKEEHRG